MRLKRKVVLMIVIEVVFLILLGVFLMQMQTSLSLSDQEGNIETKLSQMETLMADADASAQEITATFDDVYQGKAGSVAFMFQNGVLDGYTTANMQQAKELLEVDNVFILDRNGSVLAQAEETTADFSISRYNQLRAVLTTGEPSEAFEVNADGVQLRYYAAKIDSRALVVVAQDPKVLDERLDTTTVASVLEKVTVGLNGYAFSVSAKDYTFEYYPDEALIGTDAIAAGLEADSLHDGNFSWFTVDGQRMYGGITKINDSYILCVVTAEELLASRNATVLMILFVMFMVLTLVIAYAFFIIREGKYEEDDKRVFREVAFGRRVAFRSSIVAAIGLIAVLVISFYMQTLFSLSRQSMSNSQRLDEIESTFDSYSEQSEVLTERYNSRYLNKAKIAAYVLSQKPELAAREKLAELSGILSIECINVFDANGVQTATNSLYTVFSLSNDPEDQSYPFWRLLHGMESYVQEAQVDDVSGEFHQYIGVTLRDENAIPTGFVQISVIPSMLSETKDNMQIENILSGIVIGKSGIVFAVDEEDGTFAYHPSSKMVGRESAEYGLTETELTDGYVGYITMNNTKYFAASRVIDGYDVFVAVPDNHIGTKRLQMTLAAGLAALVALIVIILVMTLYVDDASARVQKRIRKAKEEAERRRAAAEAIEEAGLGEENVETTMPDGTVKMTSSAVSRWALTFTKWDRQTAGQKFVSVLKGLLTVFALVITISILMKDQIFESNSVFLFVISGKWSRGLNVFAVTGCLMIFCVGSVLVIIVQRILSAMARASEAKGETIFRLIKSLVKYISVIAMLYYSLALFGVDTATLLASAGILTLVVGLGAQKLVADILAGLFIIFEGEYRVGDIVNIGGFRGTVVEIGVRTTKIVDGNKNIKIINNSSVSGVLNMTRDYSYCGVDASIEFDGTLEEAEALLKNDLTEIASRLPKIVDGPFYKGVVALTDTNATLRIVALCSEKDRIQLERDFNRELKILFDRNGIKLVSTKGVE